MNHSLPVLGVGVSLSLSEKPDPVELAGLEDGPQFVEYAGLVDVERVIEDVQRVKSANLPILFHPSFINFCGSFENDADWLDATAHHIETVGSPWFAQDVAYCFWDKAHGYSSQFGYFIPPLLNRASLELAVKRIEEVKNRVSVPVAIEPPPVCFTIGHMHALDFFGQLANEADCCVLLDMGHLVSYEMASGKKMLDAIGRFPVERVVELHIAGGKIRDCEHGPVYIDAHEQNIRQETWEMLDNILPLLPALKAVCFECEGVDQQQVMEILKVIRDKVISLSTSQSLLEAVTNGRNP